MARRCGSIGTVAKVAAVALLFGAASPARAAEAPRFTADVAPLLVQKCQGCHGPEKAKGHYRLDTFERLTKQGDGGAAPVAPGEPAHSELFLRITSHDPEKRMPQKDDPLSPAQVALVEAWIRGGAKFDGPDRAAPLSTIVPSAQQPHPAAPQIYPRPVPVVALAFQPDGKALAAGGYNEVTLWDPADGRLLRRIGNIPRQTHGLAFSPDGSLLAVAGGTPGSAGEVRLIELAKSSPASAPPTPATPATPASTASTSASTASADSSASAATSSRVLDRIGDVMLCVAFSPDGARLTAGGADGAVRVYDVATGKRLLSLEQHADWVTGVAFSPDGTRLASASRDKSVRVIDAKTGEAASAYLGHEAPVFAVAWAPDGRLVYSGGKDRKVHAWEPAAEGKKIADAAGFGGDVLRLVAVAGDSLFACSADGKVRQFRTRANKAGEKPDLELVRTFDGSADWAYALAFDAKNARLAAGGFDGTVRVFSADDGKSVSTFVAAPGYSAGARTPSTSKPSDSSGG
jgi:WD40 repeat protein